MLGLLVSYQTAPLRCYVTTGITRILLLSLLFNTAWKTGARVVNLIEAIPRGLLHLLVLHLDRHLHRLVLLRRRLQVQRLVVIKPPGVGGMGLGCGGVGAGSVGQVLGHVLPPRHHEVRREVTHGGGLVLVASQWPWNNKKELGHWSKLSKDKIKNF